MAQMIPRFFWAAKPRSHVATYELGIYYGLQREEDTVTTTIAFGLLTEAYANFGLIGAVLLGAFWGLMLKKLQIWSTFSPMFFATYPAKLNCGPPGVSLAAADSFAASAKIDPTAFTNAFPDCGNKTGS